MCLKDPASRVAHTHICGSDRLQCNVNSAPQASCWYSLCSSGCSLEGDIQWRGSCLTLSPARCCKAEFATVCGAGAGQLLPRHLQRHSVGSAEFAKLCGDRLVQDLLYIHNCKDSIIAVCAEFAAVYGD